MKFCDTHWDALKQALKDRGLWHLVGDGESLKSRVTEEIEGTHTTASYDPLWDATNMIYANALQRGGLYLLQGDYCPLCEVDKHSPATGTGGSETAEDWITGCTDAILGYCLDNDLRPRHD